MKFFFNWQLLVREFESYNKVIVGIPTKHKILSFNHNSCDTENITDIPYYYKSRSCNGQFLTHNHP